MTNHSYLFCVRIEADIDLNLNVSLDGFHKVKMPLFDGDQTAFEVARRIEPTLGDEDARALHGMTLRAHFNAEMKGPYLVHIDEPLERNEFEDWLRAITSSGDLGQFLKDARI